MLFESRITGWSSLFVTCSFVGTFSYMATSNWLWKTWPLFKISFKSYTKKKSKMIKFFMAQPRPFPFTWVYKFPEQFLLCWEAGGGVGKDFLVTLTQINSECNFLILVVIIFSIYKPFWPCPHVLLYEMKQK